MMEQNTPFTCHLCKNKSGQKKILFEFDTMELIRQHRRDFHSLDFADGLNFWMAEDKIGRIDYYMIAKSIRDTKWLRSWK